MNECAAVSLRGLVAAELLGHLDDLHEKRNVVDFEVAAQGALFLGSIDKYRSVSSDPGARASEGVGREASVHQEIAESAVVCHAQGDHVEKVDKTFPASGISRAVAAIVSISEHRVSNRAWISSSLLANRR